MKKLEMIVRPERLDAVKESLNGLGVKGLTVSEVVGAGNQKGRPATWRGAVFTLELLPKVKLEVVVADDAVEPIVDAVCAAAHTGEVGDGKIFVLDVAEAIRVRTRARGEEAI